MKSMLIVSSSEFYCLFNVNFIFFQILLGFEPRGSKGGVIKDDLMILKF